MKTSQKVNQKLFSQETNRFLLSVPIKIENISIIAQIAQKQS